MVFANSRLHTEFILTYLQQANPQPPGAARNHPRLSRRLSPERTPRNRTWPARRQIRGVVSTNALELGIDVGSLDTVVMAGYPGTIAATWQRAGRAGRRDAAVPARCWSRPRRPLDQYIVRNPDYFFGNTPEHAFIQPDNLEILVNHLKCAAFELPISPTRPLRLRRCARSLRPPRRSGLPASRRRKLSLDPGSLPRRHRQPALRHQRQLHHHRHHRGPHVIGEVDFSSALTTVHEKAIYIHGGQQYHVEHLDFKERKAYVKRVDVDYYTDAIRYTEVRMLECAEESRVSTAGEPSTPKSESGGIPSRSLRGWAERRTTDPSDEAFQTQDQSQTAALRSHGDVLVRSQVVGFKKLKFFTNENIGAGNLELPENEMHTTSYWLTLERALVESLPFSISDRQSGMFGLLHAMATVATLLLMCDRRDLGTAIGEKPPYPDNQNAAAEAVQLRDRLPQNVKDFFEPNLYIYDAYPGGIGFSEPLFRNHHQLMLQTRELIRHCECAQGCPSCVGPAGDLTPYAKDAALAILEHLLVPPATLAQKKQAASSAPTQQLSEQIH